MPRIFCALPYWTLHVAPAMAAAMCLALAAPSVPSTFVGTVQFFASTASSDHLSDIPATLFIGFVGCFWSTPTFVSFNARATISKHLAKYNWRFSLLKGLISENRWHHAHLKSSQVTLSIGVCTPTTKRKLFGPQPYFRSSFQQRSQDAAKRWSRPPWCHKSASSSGGNSHQTFFDYEAIILTAQLRTVPQPHLFSPFGKPLSLFESLERLSDKWMLSTVMEGMLSNSPPSTFPTHLLYPFCDPTHKNILLHKVWSLKLRATEEVPSQLTRKRLYSGYFLDPKRLVGFFPCSRP